MLGRPRPWMNRTLKFFLYVLGGILGVALGVLVFQAIEIWNDTPVSILDQQAVHTHALLLAMGKYITYRKERGELENCTDASDFLDRFIRDV
jgi:hypothetical protein